MRFAAFLVAALALAGCDAASYKKLHDRHAKLFEEHQALSEEHAQLRKETKALLEATVKDRRLTGLKVWSPGEELEGERYVDKIRCLRDHDEITVEVRYDVGGGGGTKPNYEIFFHDSTGRVIGRCGKKRIWKKISADYTGDTLEGELATPIAPAFYSVTIR